MIKIKSFSEGLCLGSFQSDGEAIQVWKVIQSRKSQEEWQQLESLDLSHCEFQTTSVLAGCIDQGRQQREQ